METNGNTKRGRFLRKDPRNEEAAKERFLDARHRLAVDHEYLNDEMAQVARACGIRQPERLGEDER